MPATLRNGIRTNAPDTIFSSVLANSTVETTLIGWTFPPQWLQHPWGIRFTAVINLTTALLPPILTVRLKLGASSVDIISGQLLNLQPETSITLEGAIFSQALAQQRAYSVLQKPSLILPGENVRTAFAEWTENVSAGSMAQITAQFSGLIATSQLRLFAGLAEIR